MTMLYPSTFWWLNLSSLDPLLLTLDALDLFRDNKIMLSCLVPYTLQWRHYGRHGVSNHPPRDCLPNLLFWHRSKKTSNLRVTGLCAGNSPVTGDFPAQMASNVKNVSIWWRHHSHGNNTWSCETDVTILWYLYCTAPTNEIYNVPCVLLAHTLTKVMLFLSQCVLLQYCSHQY